MKPRAGIIFGHCLLVLLVVVSTVFAVGLPAKQANADTLKCETCNIGGQTSASPGPHRYPVMLYTPEQVEEENRLLETAPPAYIDQSIARKSQLDTYTEGASRNLLPLLQYTPSQRNQGNCGNCWVWAGTGCMEFALRAQQGITENRLSVQYFNSTYNGGTGTDPGWACCGGNAETFANYYKNTLKKAVPWSNTNAGYADGGRTCYSSTAMPAGSISTTPNYPISNVTYARIPTYSSLDGVSQATAIQNIKNVLDQDKGIYFGFTLANDADWDQFFNFWNTQAESYLWPYGFSNNGTYINGQTGGHAVLCVGYDDTPEGTANDYWVMLNSWGAPSNRTNGLFRVPMYYNYDSYINGYGYSTRWYTIEPTFTGGGIPSAPTLSSPSNGSTVSGTSVTFTWNAVSGATDYSLWVATTPNFASGTVKRFGKVGNVTSYTDTGYPNDGTVYYSNLYAWNTAGWSPVSATYSFTNGTIPKPASPTLSSPANGSTVSGSSVTYTWSATSGATDYSLWVATTSNFASGTVKRFGKVGNVTNYTDAGYPNNGTVYYWNLYAWNSAGWGPVSATYSFTNGGLSKPGTPSLSLPANGSNAGGTSVTYSWSAASGATDYSLWVATTPNFASGTVKRFGKVGNVTTYTDTGYPADGTVYYWNLYAWNTAGWSPVSETWNFTNVP